VNVVDILFLTQANVVDMLNFVKKSPVIHLHRGPCRNCQCTSGLHTMQCLCRRRSASTVLE